MPARVVEPEAPIHPAVRAAEEAFADEVVKQNLVGRLAAIMASLPDVQPEGRNPHFGYSYISDKQVLGLLRPRLGARGILIVPDVEREELVTRTTAKGKESLLTKLTVLFTVMDSDTGQQISGHGVGYGDDEGDKGANKAFTAALKNWLIKLFLIGGEADTEADANTDTRYEEDDEGRRVNIGDSHVEGVERGGRQTSASEVQVRQIVALTREKQLGTEGVLAAITTVLGDELEVPEDRAKASEAILAYLKGLSAIDAGKLVTHLAEVGASPSEEPK